MESETTTGKNFEYYLDAYYAAVNEMQKLEVQGVKNLVIATNSCRHQIELVEYYKEGAPIASPLNTTVEVYKYKKKYLTKNSATMKTIAAVKRQKTLSSLNTNKKVRFDYKVVDCEHEGDVSYASMECEIFCREYGGTVVNEYWDGEDCGEAYITCEFPFDKVEEVLMTDFFDYNPYQQ